MAKAVVNIKTVKVVGGVTLTLTPTEAIVLRALLGSVQVGRGDSPGFHTNKIYAALGSAGVPTINNYEDIATASIDFKGNAERLVSEAQDKW